MTNCSFPPLKSTIFWYILFIFVLCCWSETFASSSLQLLQCDYLVRLFSFFLEIINWEFSLRSLHWHLWHLIQWIFTTRYIKQHLWGTDWAIWKCGCLRLGSFRSTWRISCQKKEKIIISCGAQLIPLGKSIYLSMYETRGRVEISPPALSMRIHQLTSWKTATSLSLRYKIQIWICKERDWRYESGRINSSFCHSVSCWNTKSICGCVIGVLRWLCLISDTGRGASQQDSRLSIYSLQRALGACQS